MQFMIRGRQEGKTTKLAEWAGTNPLRRILVPNQRQIDFIVHQHGKALGLDKDSWSSAEQDRIVTPGRYRRFGEDMREYEYSVDNLDMILRNLIGSVHVEIVTATGELI